MTNSIHDLWQLIQNTPTKSQLREKSVEVQDKFAEVAAETQVYAPKDGDSIGVSADENFSEEFSYIKDLLRPFEEPRPDLFMHLAEDIHAIRTPNGPLGDLDMEQDSAIFTYLSQWESDAITKFNEGYADKLSGVVDNDKFLIGGLAHLTCAIGTIYAWQRIDAMAIADATIQALEALRVDDIESSDPTILLKVAAGITAIGAAISTGGAAALVAASLGAIASVAPSPKVRNLTGINGEQLKAGEVTVYTYAGAYASTLSGLSSDVEGVESEIRGLIEKDLSHLAENEEQYVGTVSEIMSSNNDSIDNTITPS